MKRPLTDALIRTMPAPTAGRLDVSDSACRGLQFRVTTAGARSFSFRFRDPASGRLQRQTIGPYPEITLAKARARADELRRAVAEGSNPVEDKRKDRADATTKTFAALAERFVKEHALRFKRSGWRDERNLELHVLPKWRNRRYDSITRADVIELVEGMIAAGKATMANRIHALISTVFSFAVDASLLDANPCTRLRKRGVENVGRRILSDDEIRLFWTRCVLPPVSRRVGLALRLLLLTGCRSGEVAGLSRGELRDMDEPDKAAWLLPPERVKNGRAHLVPLSALARQSVEAAFELIAADREFVFPGRTDDAPMTGHACTVAMVRMAKTLPPDAPGAATWVSDPPTPHDLRRTCATRLAALGIPAEDVSAVLNHIRADVTGRHYDTYDRLAEKRRALDRLAAAIERILANTSASVLPFRGRT